MTIPHLFPSLIEGPTQVVLVAGTGLSTPNAPTVDDLKGRLDQVAQTLGVIPTGDFYELAEAVLKSLIVSQGRPDSESRLWLAEKLGMLDDRQWFGGVGMPLSGNTPRHRALARFAVEKRLRAIVSLNWDTLLEAALDSVGLADCQPRSPRPWEVTAHARVVEDNHIPNIGSVHVFPVIKPHGCVRDLKDARRRFRLTGVIQSVTFKLTKLELESLLARQTLVDQTVQGYVAQCPLIAVGWKATEGYLRNAIIATAKKVQHTTSDAFTLVSRSWYPNAKSGETYHADIATAYGRAEPESFARAGNLGGPTLDCLLQWLQARHAFSRLIAAASPPQTAVLQHKLQQLAQPNFNDPILAWTDSWLPTWVRLCWKSGVMTGIVDPITGQKIEPWDIPITPRDIHVPLGGLSVERRDLQAAGKLLVALGNDLGRFNFERFPGGFWDAIIRCLYVPLPGWRGTAQPADLAALKPLVEALRGMGFVQKIQLVWLDSGNTPPEQQLRHQLEAQVRRLMPATRFATGDALSWVDLEELKGGLHAAVA